VLSRGKPFGVSMFEKHIVGIVFRVELLGGALEKSLEP